MVTIDNISTFLKQNYSNKQNPRKETNFSHFHIDLFQNVEYRVPLEHNMYSLSNIYHWHIWYIHL
jgi:hypothetical protein